MQRRKLKRIALTFLSVFLILVLALCIHICIVTRPVPSDPHARVMARIDIRQPITSQDAARISNWLYSQKGVDHVVINPQRNIALFTFIPAQNSADRIVRDFKTDLPYDAQRVIPSPSQTAAGCPAMCSSTFADH